VDSTGVTFRLVGARAWRVGYTLMQGMNRQDPHAEVHFSFGSSFHHKNKYVSSPDSHKTSKSPVSRIF